jgi:hypothetical protein
MKKSEVPQDKSNLESVNLRELCYAVDENGEYTTEHTTGWDPKTIALNNAMDDIKERVAIAKKKVLANETSPIEYYMELHKMDISVLASYMGIWKWRVKKHFKPAVFKRLSSRTLQKYADTFDISVEELQHIDI